MNKTATVVLAAMMAAFLAGCATTAASRVYPMSATGYAEIQAGNTGEAKTQAVANARQNLVSSIAKFMEYKFEINPEIEQKILFNSKAGREGVQNNTYFAEIGYDLDLNDFLAKNGDFRNIYAWELLGLTPFYSDYINSARPIGIWIKDQLSEGKRRDPVGMGALSALPCFSANFVIGKPVVGCFFTAAKMLCLGGAVLKAEQSQEVKIASWAGLVAMTVLDVMSAFTETSEMNRKLKDLQDALYAGGSNSGAVSASVKF